MRVHHDNTAVSRTLPLHQTEASHVSINPFSYSETGTQQITKISTGPTATAGGHDCIILDIKTQSPKYNKYTVNY